jgi:ribosomal protein S18 acetylase RimI-like enzyme
MSTSVAERFRVVPIGEADATAVVAFFARVPEGDRTFFKEDVLDHDAVAEWVRHERGRRWVATDSDGGDPHRVVGYVAVVPLIGWSSHVGEVRLVVDAATRGAGVGRALARAALLGALETGLTKIVVEVVADQSPAIDMFQALGFTPEALLHDHVRDRHGELRDLVVLAHSVEDTWSGFATAGVDQEVS